MNYGYNSSCEDYQENKVSELVKQLTLFLQQWSDLGIDKPYLEVNGLYDGVRIRKITHLSEKEQKKLVKGADKIYERIMLK